MQLDLKKVCRDVTRYAIRTETLKRPERCETCDKVRWTIPHHPNYHLPMKVVWMCTKCHSKLHGEERRGMKYQRRNPTGRHHFYRSKI